ncbi:MAG: hypothetical protein WBD18_09555, partial [Phycisphaerae bacterium]
LRTGAGTQFDEAAVGAAIAAAEEARDWPLQDSLSDPVEEVCASASGAGPWRRIPPPSRT